MDAAERKQIRTPAGRCIAHSKFGADDSLHDRGSMIEQELPTLTGASSHPLLPLGR